MKTKISDNSNDNSKKRLFGTVGELIVREKLLKYNIDRDNI